MRRHLLLACLIAAPLAMTWTGCQTPTGAVTPVRIRVLSYNIHHGEGMDGRLDLERIAAVIRSSGADLAALQEVDRNTLRTGGVDQAAELGRLTGLHAAFGEAMPYQGGGYGEALLSRWPLYGITTHALPASAAREPRAALSALVRAGNGGPPIRLVGTHLDHLRDDTDRRAQGERLSELFEVPDVPPTLLVGDFNATPERVPMPSLLARWKDAAGDRPEPTVPVDRPTRRIDYILARPASQWRVLRVTTLPEAMASDHRAVMAELEWTP